ncbi:hypothetical protein GCM10009731_10020 [Streptomyces globosus]
MKPYVDQGWEYVAVRLAPQDGNEPLRGNLDPLRIRFDSDRLVYPMRLSRMAETPQTLGLYVLADHRMEPASAIGGAEPEVTFAGRITPQQPLASLTDGKEAFLTAIEQRFPHPARIDGDHELRATAADTPYRRVVYRDRLLEVGGVPAWLLVLGAVLATAAAAAATRLRRRAARTAPPA